MNILELIGYLGSALIVISLTRSSVVRLRLWNLAGAAVFCVYAVLIQAWPVVALNVANIGINLWHLARMLRQQDFFELLDLGGNRTRYVERFLAFYAEDIARYIPGFDLGRLEAPSFVFVLRDMQPAALIIYTRPNRETACVELDFVVPRYRDLQCGRYFFEHMAPILAEQGVKRYATRTSSDAHRSYLGQIGFSNRAGCADACDANCWRRDLPGTEAP